MPVRTRQIRASLRVKDYVSICFADCGIFRAELSRQGLADFSSPSISRGETEVVLEHLHVTRFFCNVPVLSALVHIRFRRIVWSQLGVPLRYALNVYLTIHRIL